jgi:hypothetical protein
MYSRHLRRFKNLTWGNETDRPTQTLSTEFDMARFKPLPITMRNTLNTLIFASFLSTQSLWAQQTPGDAPLFTSPSDRTTGISDVLTRGLKKDNAVKVFVEANAHINYPDYRDQVLNWVTKRLNESEVLKAGSVDDYDLRFEFASVYGSRSETLAVAVFMDRSIYFGASNEQRKIMSKHVSLLPLDLWQQRGSVTDIANGSKFLTMALNADAPTISKAIIDTAEQLAPWAAEFRKIYERDLKRVTER